jgi:hypothetical protein
VHRLTFRMIVEAAAERDHVSAFAVEGNEQNSRAWRGDGRGPPRNGIV